VHISKFKEELLAFRGPPVPTQVVEGVFDFSATKSQKYPSRFTSLLPQYSSPNRQQLSHLQKVALDHRVKKSERVTESSSPQRNVKVDRAPISRTEGELLFFKEIFIQPKEDNLENLKLALKQERFDMLLKNPRIKDQILVRTESEPVFATAAPILDKEDNTFYAQQLQVQPPEGLNATVAAPLTPGGGWAPSIPAGSSTIERSSLKDMTLRAKSGVQAGDVQKEAHMAFSLAVLHEVRFRHKETAKFYKRFFFCARILEDPVGAALALNRLGVVYHNMHKPQKSLQFHLKHLEFADRESQFAAFYNLGVVHRTLGNYADSLQFFEQALEWAQVRYNYESECLSLGQQGCTYQALGQVQQAMHCLSNSYELALRLKNSRVQLDTLMSLGYLASSTQDQAAASHYFGTASTVARVLGELKTADQCVCNVGIAEAQVRLQQFQARLVANYHS
jgi:tetratricopeptide (TPR) repeat protein